MKGIVGCFIMPHPPILIPEIGKGEEKSAIKTINACVEAAKAIKDLKPDTIIYITPHGPLFSDAISILFEDEVTGDFKGFGLPSSKLSLKHKINKKFIELLNMECLNDGCVTTFLMDEREAKRYGMGVEFDHGVSVPMFFIDKEYDTYEAVQITYGLFSEIELYKFGMLINKVAEKTGERVVIVASGDLSHKLSDRSPYSYAEEGSRFDSELVDKISKDDVIGIFNMDKSLVKCAGECGMRSFYIMYGCLNDYSYTPSVLSYEGPFGVGYAVVEFNINGKKERGILDLLNRFKEENFKRIRDDEDEYVSLARQSLEYYLNNGEELTDFEVSKELLENKYGVFVSLKKHGELRGCIGTIFPTQENVAQEIIENAISAGIRDFRFEPVDVSELDEIEYSVDVLMPPVKASYEELDPKKYGVIVRSRGKAGLLLPDLEGIDSVSEQVDIALKKAGIKKDEEYTIEKFEVIRHR